MKQYFKRVVQILLTVVIIVLWASKGYSQGDYDKTLKARDTLFTQGQFTYRDTVIPVLDISYHLWSADGVTWRKNYISGDKYVKFSNDVKNSYGTIDMSDKYWINSGTSLYNNQSYATKIFIDTMGITTNSKLWVNGNVSATDYYYGNTRLSLTNLYSGTGTTGYVLTKNGNVAQWLPMASGSGGSTARNVGIDGYGVFEDSLLSELRFRNIAEADTFINVSLEDSTIRIGWDGSDRQLIAGNGLSGGGDLSSNRTLDIYIPELTAMPSSVDGAADWLLINDASNGTHYKVHPNDVSPNQDLQDVTDLDNKIYKTTTATSDSTYTIRSSVTQTSGSSTNRLYNSKFYTTYSGTQSQFVVGGLATFVNNVGTGTVSSLGGTPTVINTGGASTTTNLSGDPTVVNTGDGTTTTNLWGKNVSIYNRGKFNKLMANSSLVENYNRDASNDDAYGYATVLRNSGVFDGYSGFQVDATNTGKMGNMNGLLIGLYGDSIDNMYGVRLGGVSHNWTGSPTNSYGIYIDQSIDRGTVSKYSIYSLSTSLSLFSGKIQHPDATEDNQSATLGQLNDTIAAITMSVDSSGTTRGISLSNGQRVHFTVGGETTEAATQTLVGTTPVWDVTNGKNAQISTVGSTTITMFNLTDGMEGSLYVTSNSTDYRITFAGYTVKIYDSVWYSGDTVAASGSGKNDIYSYKYMAGVLIINGALDLK